MTRIFKILINNTCKNIKKSSFKQAKPSLKFSNKALNYSLVALGIIGFSTMYSCSKEYPTPIYTNKDMNRKIFSGVLIDDFNSILKELGLVVDSTKSIKDIKTYSYKSNSDESFFIKPLQILNDEIILKQIKFNNKLEREDSILKINSVGKEIYINQIIDDNEIEIMLQKADDEIKIFTKIDSIWVENSVVKKYEKDSFIQIYSDDTSKLFYDIKNNVEMPEDIIFEPVEEIEDNVTFQ